MASTKEKCGEAGKFDLDADLAQLEEVAQRVPPGTLFLIDGVHISADELVEKARQMVAANRAAEAEQQALLVWAVRHFDDPKCPKA